MRTAVVAFFCAMALPSNAGAQLGFHVGVRGSYLPLYGGDATVGSVSGSAATLEAGLSLGASRQTEVSSFYTISPRSDDPYNRTPQIVLAGLLLSVWRGVDSPVGPVFSLGLGAIDVVPSRIENCEPPLCFNEGGPTFGDARFVTAVGGLGLDIRIVENLRLRVDGRVHWPLGADEAAAQTGDRRLEIGAGIHWLMR
jgi:hypothetical protein